MSACMAYDTCEVLAEKNRIGNTFADVENCGIMRKVRPNLIIRRPEPDAGGNSKWCKLGIQSDVFWIAVFAFLTG